MQSRLYVYSLVIMSSMDSERNEFVHLQFISSFLKNTLLQLCVIPDETVFPKLVEDTKRGVFLDEANLRLRPIVNEQPNR
jgi:hypothetical protein